MVGMRGPEMGCASLRGKMDGVGVDWGEVVDRVTRVKGDDDRDD